MKGRVWTMALVGGLLALPMTAMGQSYTVNFTATPPSIDGSVADGEWDAAEPITGFTSHDSGDAEDSAEPTEVRALYSVDGLYVLFNCTDTDVIAGSIDSERYGAHPDDFAERIPAGDAGWTFANTDYLAIYLDPANVANDAEVDNGPDFYSYSLQMEPSNTALESLDERGLSHNYTEAGQFGGAQIKLDEPYESSDGNTYYWVGGLSWEVNGAEILDGPTDTGYVMEVFLPWSDLNAPYYLRGAEFLEGSVFVEGFATNEFATQGMLAVDGGLVTGMPTPGTVWKAQFARHSASASVQYVNWVGDTTGFVSRPFGDLVFGDAPATAVLEALQHMN